MVSITDSFRKNSSRTQKPRKQIKTIPLGNALMSQFDQKRYLLQECDVQKGRKCYLKTNLS